MDRPGHVPSHLVVDYDAFAPTAIDEVRARIESWRELGPIVWTDSNYGHWIVLSASHTRTILSDPAGFSSATPRRGVTLMRVDRDLQIPIEMDGADHRQYRRVIMPIFSPRRIALLEERVNTVVHELIERIRTTATCDVVADFARPLASAMFLGMLDWPLEDREYLEKLADRSLNGYGATMEERGAAKVEAGKRLIEYVQTRVESSRAAGAVADDMTATLIHSVLDDGQPIPDDRLLGLLKLLLIAGLDTTQSVLSQSLLLLGSNADLQRRVRSAGDEMPRMVEELLRLHAPAMPSRVATADVMIGDLRIAKGDTVHLLLAAANYDEAEFEAPQEADFERLGGHHLTFSVGPHKCIGAALARLVLAVALREFHAAFASYRVLDAASHGGAVWGMDRVELALEVATTPA